jgi:hypothetical protein
MRSIVVMVMLLTSTVAAQDSVYKNTFPADPPYYRVRYEASTVEGELFIRPATRFGYLLQSKSCAESSSISMDVEKDRANQA